MKSTNTPTPLRQHHTVCKLLSIVFAAALFCVTMTSPVHAAGLQNSNFYKGTLNLVNDASKAIAIIGPLVCGVFAGYYFARKSMSDDQDDKQWNRRIVKAVICAVAIGLVSALIALVTSYYQTP